MTPDPRETARYRNLLVGNSILTYVHIAIVLIVTLVYLYKVPLSRLPRCAYSCGTLQVLRAAVLTLPFLVSAFYSARRFSASWLHSVLFGAILIMGAVMTSTLFIESSEQNRLTNTFVFSVAATFVYIATARFLLRSDDGA